MAQLDTPLSWRQVPAAEDVPVLVAHIATASTYAPRDERERSTLDFAVRLTEESHRPGPEDGAALRAAGWSDEESMDIAQVAAMSNFTNRLASGLGSVPNPEY